MNVDKWNWMMDYCKERGLSPAEEWVWKKAEFEYDNRGDRYETSRV